MSLTDVDKLAQAGGEQLEVVAVDGLTPKGIAHPESNEEVALILREANAAGQKVAPRGGGTKTGLGNPIQALDVVVSTLGLNKILEYSPADLMIGVQAGVRLADIQAELEKNEQFLPIESVLAGRATIGGAIAANTSGPTRLQYGPARDWLIGTRFVLADGTQAHSGGRVVKNVAGFDMNKIYIGSLGTLGIIVDMNFKLLPMPKASSTLLITFSNPLQATEAALKIIDAGLFPISETVLDERGAAAVGLPAKSTLLVEFRNTAQAVERQLRDSRNLVKPFGGAGIERIAERDKQKELWTKVTDFAYRPELLASQSFSLKAGILPTHVPDFIRQAQLLGGKNGLQVEVLSHAGHGILYFTAQYEDEEAALKTITDFTAKVETNGGSVTAERLPLSLKRRLNDVWGNALTEGELKLMRGIREKLDPNKTLNPGRFVGKM